MQPIAAERCERTDIKDWLVLLGSRKRVLARCSRRCDRNWCIVAVTMTRPDQKRSERRTLDAVFAALGLRPDEEPLESGPHHRR